VPSNLLYILMYRNGVWLSVPMVNWFLLEVGSRSISSPLSSYQYQQDL